MQSKQPTSAVLLFLDWKNPCFSKGCYFSYDSVFGFICLFSFLFVCLSLVSYFQNLKKDSVDITWLFRNFPCKGPLLGTILFFPFPCLYLSLRNYWKYKCKRVRGSVRRQEWGVSYSKMPPNWSFMCYFNSAMFRPIILAITTSDCFLLSFL